MSEYQFGGYQRERIAIEAFFLARWVEFTEGWAEQVSVAMDGQAFDLQDASGNPIFNRIRLTIKSGAVLQGSIGRTLNRIDHIGTLTATIYTEGGKGSATWRRYAEQLQDMLHGVSIEDDGQIARTTEAVFLRFSPPQLAPNEHPYIAADFDDPPYHITNVVAPFVRYGFR